MAPIGMLNCDKFASCQSRNCKYGWISRCGGQDSLARRADCTAGDVEARNQTR